MSTPSPSRRRFLAGAGLAGAAISLGPVLLPMRELLAAATGAQADATAPPTAAQLTAFAHSLEQAATQFYGDLASGGKVTDGAVQQHLATFADHHKKHAESMFPLLGGEKPPPPNPRLTQSLADQLRDASTSAEATRVAMNLESALADTYLLLLGSIVPEGTGESENKRRLVQMAAILPAESQHAVVLGAAIGLPVGTATATGLTPDQVGQVPAFEVVDNAIPPDQFPVVILPKKA